MKKLFLALLLMNLVFNCSANAKEIKPDLREVTLNEQQTPIAGNYSADTLIASETDTVNKDSIITKEGPLTTDEHPLINKTIKKLNFDENRLFKIYNLKGGIEKLESSIDTIDEKPLVKQWLDGDYATAKWFGARPILEDHGLSINSSLLYSPFIKTGGGANGEGSGKGYSLFNLSATLDTEKAGLWKGGTFFTLYQRKTGYGLAGPSGAMGDWMTFDGWEGRQINQISECWYQQKLFNNKVRLKVGKQDANVDFGFLNSGWDFMNLAFSVNPTIPMPTYPDQANIGFVAEINPKEWLSIRNGIYSKFNVPFNISEIEFKPRIKKLPGRYSLGAWEMSDSNGMYTLEGIDYSTSTIYVNEFNRNFGAYAQFEQMVYKEKKDDDNDMQGLVVFGQFGISPSNRNDMNKYMGGGIEYIGPIPKRDKDKVGIAVANGMFAPRLGDAVSVVGSETAIEAFYRVQVTPWFYLQPDVQFISRPSGYYDSSVAIGLRSVITF